MRNWKSWRSAWRFWRKCSLIWLMSKFVLVVISNLSSELIQLWSKKEPFTHGAWPLQGHGVARWSNKDAWKTSWKMLKKCFNKLSWDLWALQCLCLIMRQMRLYHGPKAKLMRFYSEENVCVQVILEVWEVKFYFINPK